MLKKILKFKVTSLTFLFSLFFVLAATTWGYFSLRNLGGPIILHFNNLTGITKISDFHNLILIGVAATVVVVINFFIAMELEERDRFLGKLAAAATLLFSLLLFVGFAAIISVN